MILNPVTNDTDWSGYPEFFPLDDQLINPELQASNLLDPELPDCLEGKKKELLDAEIPEKPALFTRPSGNPTRI